jgi:chromosome segregation and condensation protein ScpB
VSDGAEQLPELARTVEALLFLSTDPLSIGELAEAAEVGEGAVTAALALLGERHAPGRSWITLRELGGGWTLASDPSARLDADAGAGRDARDCRLPAADLAP